MEKFKEKKTLIVKRLAFEASVIVRGKKRGRKTFLEQKYNILAKIKVKTFNFDLWLLLLKLN